MCFRFDRHDAAILAVLAGGFILLGLLYCFATPLWVPPDEERHFAYCEYIARHNSLPALLQNDDSLKITESKHPPLYYMLASLLCPASGPSIHQNLLINDGPGFVTLVTRDVPSGAHRTAEHEAYAIRILSLLLSFATIGSIYLLVRRFFPDGRPPAIFAAVFVGANPQFLHISASVSNETCAAALCAMLFLVLADYVQTAVTWRHHLAVSILFGLCLLTKISTVIYAPAICIALVYAYRYRISLSCGPAVIIGCGTLLIAGWWYLRNWLLYNDPVFSRALTGILPFTVRYGSPSMASFLNEVKIMFVSFFGFFGALQIPIKPAHIWFYGCIVGTGVFGCAAAVKFKRHSTVQAKVLALAAVAVGFACILLFVLNLRAYVFMGKYFFVVLAPLALMVCAGLRFFSPAKYCGLVWTGLIVSLLAVNADVLVRVVRPAFLPVHVVEMLDQPDFSLSSAALDPGIIIEQTFVAPQNNLCALRVMFSGVNPNAGGKIRFTLVEKNSPEILMACITVPVRNITDTRYFFIFPPVKNSLGKTYRFSLSTAAHEYTGIGLWLSGDDAYADGAGFENGVLLPRDLFFTAYAFNGTVPRSIWEGHRETAIRQGEYIAVRELQLYVEMPLALQKKSPTHAKLKRLRRVYGQ